MTKSRKLTPRERLFVAEYLKDKNASAAYLRAGYKGDKAGALAGRLIRKDRIRRAIEVAVSKLVQKTTAQAELSATRVLEELRRLAFFDVADFFDERDNLKPLSRIPAEARACIAGLEVARANFDKTDGKKSDEWLHKIKLSPKIQALELLGKHFKLLTDIVKVEGDWDKLAQRLASARTRVK